jgi:hypothetical protein
MAHFLNCENPRCRFILDLRLNGKVLSDPQRIVKRCPACGGAWSSTCPCCDRPLSIKLIHGLLHAACCDKRLHPQSMAA